MDWVIDPAVSYGFFRTGLAAAALVGVTSAVLSCLLVVRGQALLGDAISHAVLLGVAVGYLAGREVGVFWGALAAGVLSGVAITAIERRVPVKRDAAMGIVFTFAFALGIAIISVAQPRGIDLFHVLFGNVLGVTTTDLVLVAVSGGLVVAAVVLWFPAFHLWSFDPTTARAMGMRTGVLEYAFTVLLSAAIVASLQTVGLILVIAMLITPGATAQLLVTRLATMMVVAAGVGLLAGVGGLYASFYADIASGPAIVILVTLCFAVAFVASPRHGLVARARRSAANS
jgi:ABC-type Mn2+/Zn2+ transport system permease subunit